MINDFYEKLKFANDHRLDTFWETVYRKLFVNYSNSMPSLENSQSQRFGIDKIIHLTNGKTIYIDEKIRSKVYDDILLEYISNDKTNSPGWIEKELLIDYLAYAFLPSKTVYVFDWSLLRRTWLYYKNDWLSKYQIVKAQNNYYVTYSVAVPIKILRVAVDLATVIRLDDFEFET